MNGKRFYKLKPCFKSEAFINLGGEKCELYKARRSDYKNLK